MNLVARSAVLSLVALVGCADRAPPPGPVKLKSATHMQDFLAGKRFHQVGVENGDWWEFHSDGTFEAKVGDERARGRWEATRTELQLSALETSVSGSPFERVENRRHRLQWLDGKLNIEIDGIQYRMY